MNEILTVIDKYLDLLANQMEGDEAQRKESMKTKLMAAFKEAGVEAPPIPDEILELRHLLGMESDRGCVLAAAAYLETELAKLLERVLLEDKKMLKELFEGSGPLGTFSSRIELAYGLGYLSPLVRRDLHLIRKIRNDFAHHTGDITFEDRKIAARCAELYHDVFGEKGIPPRRKFMRVTLGVAAPIHACISEAKRPNKAKDVSLTNPQFKATLEQVTKYIEKK